MISIIIIYFFVFCPALVTYISEISCNDACLLQKVSTATFPSRNQSLITQETPQPFFFFWKLSNFYWTTRGRRKRALTNVWRAHDISNLLIRSWNVSYDEKHFAITEPSACLFILWLFFFPLRSERKVTGSPWNFSHILSVQLVTSQAWADVSLLLIAAVAPQGKQPIKLWLH